MLFPYQEDVLDALRSYHQSLKEGTNNAALIRDMVVQRTGADPTRAPVPFTMLTSALQVRDASGAGSATERIMQATTSSTEQDLYGTVMALSALDRMRSLAINNLTIFLNHDYTVPESIFGSVVDATLVRRADPKTGNKFIDLDLSIRVLAEGINPRADRTWQAVYESKVKLGLSIGALITGYEWHDKNNQIVPDEKVDVFEVLYGGNPDGLTMVITDVLLLESSVVGIPANQRSWVRGGTQRSILTEARRGLLRAGVLPYAPRDVMAAQKDADMRSAPSTKGADEMPAETKEGQSHAALSRSDRSGPGVSRAERAETESTGESAAAHLSLDDLESQLGLIPSASSEPTGDDDDPEYGAGESLDTSDIDALERRLLGGDDVSDTPADPNNAASSPDQVGAITLAASATSTSATTTTPPEGAPPNPDYEQAVIDIARFLRAPDLTERAASPSKNQAMAAAHDNAAHTLGMTCCGLPDCTGHSNDPNMATRSLGKAAQHVTRIHDMVARAMGMTCALPDPDGDGDATPLIHDEAAAPTPELQLSVQEQIAIVDETIAVSERAAASADLQREMGTASALLATFKTEIAAGQDILRRIELSIADATAERHAALSDLSRFQALVKEAEDVGIYRPTQRAATDAEDRMLTRSLAIRREDGMGTGHLDDDLAGVSLSADEFSDRDLLTMSDEEFFALYQKAR